MLKYKREKLEIFKSDETYVKRWLIVLWIRIVHVKPGLCVERSSGRGCRCGGLVYIRCKISRKGVPLHACRGVASGCGLLGSQLLMIELPLLRMRIVGHGSSSLTLKIGEVWD